LVDFDCVVHEAPRMSLFWPPSLRTYGGSLRWLRDRHLLRFFSCAERAGVGAKPRRPK